MKNEFTFTTEQNKLETEVLLTLLNSKYNEIKDKYNHLGGIQIPNTETKNLLPIHIIMGAGSDFAKIKMGTCSRVGQIGEPLIKQKCVLL